MATKKEKGYIEDSLKMIMRFIRASQGPGVFRISEITTHILISNMENACQIDLLKDYGIDVVLYFGLKKKDPQIIHRYQKKKIKHIHMPFPDVLETPDKKPQNLIPYLDSYYDIIHKHVSNEVKLLIHCESGTSLSVAVIMYYFLRRYYVTNFKNNKDRTKDLIDLRVSFLPGIVKFMKELRPCIDPHPEYIYQILLFENHIKKYFGNLLLREAKAKKKSRQNKKSDDSDSEEDPQVFDDESDDEKDIDNYLEDLEEEKKQEQEEKPKPTKKNVRFDLKEKPKSGSPRNVPKSKPKPEPKKKTLKEKRKDNISSANYDKLEDLSKIERLELEEENEEEEDQEEDQEEEEENQEEEEVVDDLDDS